MTTLAALLYADRCAFANQLRGIRRAPARAIVWLIFGLIIAGMFALRIVRASNGFGSGRKELLSGDIPTDAIVCGGLVILGLLLTTGRFGGLFANPAEARFVIGSPAPPFVTTLYIQARQIAVGGARQTFGVLYVALVYLPASLPPAAVASDIALILTAAVFIAAVPLARALLPTRLIVSVRVVGAAVTIVAALPVIRDVALDAGRELPRARLLAAIPEFHPGAILHAGTGAQLLTIVAMLACTAGLFVYVARLARESYPELYELSMKRIARTERLRGGIAGAFAPRGATVRAADSAGSAPGGVAIFVWRAWTEYRRQNGVRSAAVETGLFLVAGYACGRFTLTADTDALVALIAPVVNIAFIIGVMRSSQLAADLRRPLFWLSGATLFERLAALALAQNWRIIGWLWLVSVGLAAARAPLPLVLGTSIAFSATVLLAAAVGFASYALLPYEPDQRGPLRVLRLLFGYALLVPPVALYIVFGIVTGWALVALLAATVTMLLEAGALLFFAASRLDRTSISLR